MHCFCLDSSALAKRYAPETGSALVDHLRDHVDEDRIYILNIGYAEVVSVLVHKKNTCALPVGEFNQALVDLDQEVIRSLGKHLLSRFLNMANFGAFDSALAAWERRL